jgi:hypothetical protein
MIFTVIASSHQLTPFMVISALALLVVFQISKVLRLPILFSVITILWIIYMAVGFLAPNIYWIVKSIGTLVSNSQLVNTSVLSPVQAFIARVSQLFSISMVGLAILGFVRRVFNRSMDLPAILLIASPIPLLAANSYGGEMHLRVYYFALPFIAFLIAGLFFPRPNMGTAFRSQASVFLVSFLMLGSFMFTAYGREQMNYISPDEVNAITYLIKNAPKGSLFIGGTTNWPMLYQDYEYYQYMTILNLPPAEQKEFLANPAFEFANITKSYAHAYLILTKSQEAQIDLTHVLPPGSFSKIEDSLRSSPYFVVDFQNADAIIFSLKPGAIFPGESESSGLSE